MYWTYGIKKMYKLGASPSPTDNRDFSVRVMPCALPREYKQHIGSNYHQQESTCVAQTLRNIMREAYGTEFGTNFLYGGGRSHTYEGMIPAEAVKFLNTYGMAPARYDPGEKEVMDVIYYYRANRTVLEQKAAPYKDATYARAYTAEQIKAALHSGMYAAACFAISQWKPDRHGVWPCISPVMGYHEMRVFGWELVNGTEYACVQNSWGSSWGKRGECYISWADVLRCNDVLIIKPIEQQTHDAEIRRTLRKGMRDDGNYADVSELQSWLNSKGYNCGTADGVFGSRTKRAVKAMQKANGLTADGIVGPKTWEVIDNAD